MHETHDEYWAFLSYSRRDERAARRLHAWLERYRIPAALRKPLTTGGLGDSRRLRPIFRDRDEMSAAGDLGAHLRHTLDVSRRLVVLASPAAASSRWVAAEIEHFLAKRSLDDVIVVVVDGEPGGPSDLEPIPVALRTGGTEPLWLDARRRSRLDRRGRIRLVSALLGTRFDDLWRRDRRRRRRQAVGWAAAVVIVAGAVGLVLRSQQQRSDRELAEERARTERAEPSQQTAAFERFITRELAGGPGLDGEPIDDTDVDIQIVRTADVNGDSRLDFFVFNRTPGWCGSGGCGMELWISGEPGEYSIGLDLFGYSDPSVKASGADGYQDVTAIHHKVEGEPVYSVYRWTGEAYGLLQFEFCDGIYLEYCDPTILTPLNRAPSEPGYSVRPDAVPVAAPEAGAAMVQTSAPSTDSGAIAVTADGEWYLVEWWKGESGFVHRSDILMPAGAVPPSPGVDEGAAAAIRGGT